MDLIRLVYDYTDSEIIQLIMKEAPDSWSSILQPKFCKMIVNFQNTVKYHESTLLAMTPPSTNLVSQLPNRAFQTQRFHPWKTHANLVGWTPSLEPPKFPKGKHWDYECRHSRKGEKQARTNFILLSDPEIEALNAYDNLYYDLESERESVEDQQDFCQPLQSSDRSLQNDVPKLEDESSLGGSNKEITIPVQDRVAPTSLKSYLTTVQKPSLRFGRDLTNAKKIPLNRATRRNLAKNISKVYHTVSNPINNDEEPLVELHKYMARPPGCSFLGATATHVPVTINSPRNNSSSIVINSGSDITLISLKALDSLDEVPKVKKGQKINLVQVTGKASISGYIDLELYFHSKEGPVKIKVEAYVVKGMTTPLILGNDFADQYSLSVKRMEGRAFLEFGDSGQSMDIANLVSPKLTDEDGHAFKIRRVKSVNRGLLKKIDHRRYQ